MPNRTHAISAAPISRESQARRCTATSVSAGNETLTMNPLRALGALSGKTPALAQQHAQDEEKRGGDEASAGCREPRLPERRDGMGMQPLGGPGCRLGDGRGGVAGRL